EGDRDRAGGADDFVLRDLERDLLPALLAGVVADQLLLRRRLLLRRAGFHVGADTFAALLRSVAERALGIDDAQVLRGRQQDRILRPDARPHDAIAGFVFVLHSAVA